MKIVMMASGSVRSSLTHRALRLGSALAARGHEVVLVAPSLDKYTGFKSEKINRLDGVRVVQPFQLQTKSPLLNLLPYLAAASAAVLRERPDILYLYKPTPITLPGLLARWVLRRPVVLDMDDLGSEVMAIEGQPAPIVKLVALCERLAARNARLIVGASSYLANFYRRELPDKKVLWLPNGADTTALRPLDPTDSPQLVFFGALNRRSLLEPVLRALPLAWTPAGTAPVRLTVIGDGSELASLKRLARRLGISSQVRFVGWARPEELGRFAKAGDLGLCYMPRARTTVACSNQKIFQYMAYGLIPVVSRVGDLPAYVGRSGFVAEPDSPTDLARVIAGALSPRIDYAERSAAAVRRARRRYDWDVLAAELEGFLESELHPARRVMEEAR